MIKIGMYARTNEGHIGKVIKTYESNDYLPNEWIIQIKKDRNMIVNETVPCIYI